MHLVVVGVNHNTAPVEIRERLAVDDGLMADALARLLANAQITEACVLSTCNRTEIYAHTQSKQDDDALYKFLSDYSGLDQQILQSCTYCKPGHHAVKHIFEVACGLDSLALGEYQILGQIRNAYCIAHDNGATGTILNDLFQRAISVGKRARTETGISSGSFSIGSAAVELAKFVFHNLQGRKALLLGAGKMSGLAARHLKNNGIDKVYVCSRSQDRVQTLVDELDGEAVDLSHFEEALCRVDVVIASTSSNEPVITKGLVEKVMDSRPRSPIFLIDIAVPRDIEPECAEVEGVFLYNIDDLHFLVDKSRSEREAEMEKVKAIIEVEMEEFMRELKEMEAVPAIKQLRAKFDSVFYAEWEKCSAKIAHLNESDRECVRRAIKSAVTKLTHDPILRMKDYAANGGSGKLEIVRELFGLEMEE